jgi:ribokinase
MKNIYLFGSLNMDLVITTPYVPEAGETITGSDFMTNPGGKGANQAVACGKMGAKIRMGGACGEDGFGQTLLDNLKKSGVNIESIRKIPNASTGIAMIIMANHDNRIILSPNANALVKKEDVDSLLKDAGEGDYFVTQLENPVAIIGYALEQAKKKKMITMLNPAPANVFAKAYFPYVDILTPNETELALLEEKGKTYEEKCHNLSEEFGIKDVIVTLGSKGHGWFENGCYHTSPGGNTHPVDTTAAGDTFCGTLVTFLAKGESMEKSLAYAACASSIAVSRVGAQASIPNLSEVEEKMK